MTTFNKNLIVWVSFMPIRCSKFDKEGKSCSRLLALQKVAQNVKSCSKVAEHNLFMSTCEEHCRTSYNNSSVVHFKMVVHEFKVSTEQEKFQP